MASKHLSCIMSVFSSQSLFLQTRVRSSQMLSRYMEEMNKILEDKRNALRLARHSKIYTSVLLAQTS